MFMNVYMYVGLYVCIYIYMDVYCVHMDKQRFQKLLNGIPLKA